jgi:hypothetical protein
MRVPKIEAKKQERLDWSASNVKAQTRATSLLVVEREALHRMRSFSKKRLPGFGAVAA